MAKYEQIARTLKQRIRHGDYRLRGFPSHAGLVDELGVNARTVTRALNELIDEGILIRRETGRFDIAPESQTLHVGMISPAYASPEIARWHRRLDQACIARGCSFRVVQFTHWHDAAITEAVRRLDGVFILSLGDDFPKSIVQQIHQTETPVIVLEQDVSSHNIPCLRYANPSSIQLLIDHLRDQQRHKIACLSTQPTSDAIRRRIEAWRMWTSAYNLAGPLIDQPVELYDAPAPPAHALVTAMLEQGNPPDAIVCTTGVAAIGAMRAITDAGLRIGQDIAVCSADDNAGLARFMTPSLTCLEGDTIAPLVHACLDYLERGQDWLGPLLVEPAAMKLFVGESTQTK